MGALVKGRKSSVNRPLARVIRQSTVPRNERHYSLILTATSTNVSPWTALSACSDRKMGCTL